MKFLFKTLALALASASISHASPIPSPLNIWVLDDHDVEGAEFLSNRANYNTNPDRTLQRMILNIGDSNSRGNGDISARVEAWGGLEWQPGPTWHEFTANVNAKNAHSKSVSLAQIFDAINGPLLQVRMSPNGDLTFTDHGAHEYIDTKNPNNKFPKDGVLARGMEGKNFLLKLRSNGNWQEIYIDGVKVYAHAPHRYTANPMRHGFRWGPYTSEAVNGKIDITYWNMIRR